MAINPETQYPGKINPSDSNYPYGSARNITVPGDGTGTPWEAAIVNDLLGMQQAFLSDASVVPSGNPDKVGASQYMQAMFRSMGFVRDTIAILRALDSSVVSDKTRCLVTEDGRGGHFVLDKSDTTSADNDGTVIVDANGGRWKRWYTGPVNVRWFGATGRGVADDYAAIEAALAIVRAYGGAIFLPTNPANGSQPTVYNHGATIQFGASNVRIIGESTAVQLNYTGAGTGLIVNLSSASAHRERCGFSNISLVSSTGAYAFDFTFGSYGIYENFEIAYTATNARLIYGTGHNGAGPYFNEFKGFTLFGGGDRSQVGIEFKSDTSGNLSDGPNANQFTDLKRAASLLRGLNLVAGTGNLFANFSGESISEGFIVLNDVPSLKESGNATSFTTSTLSDTSKTWSTVQGDPLNFINSTVLIITGALAGQARRISSNTDDTLILDKAWSEDPGAGAGYWIFADKAVKNMFVNIRQEGLDSDNPDGVIIKPGARDNELSQIEIGSLGSGSLFNDESGDPSNKVRQGDLIIDTFIVENPGPSANIEVIPRQSVDGGIRAGSDMVLEYAEILSPNFVTGSAEAVLTVDHGGAAAGGGSPSLVAKINDFNDKTAFIQNNSKDAKSAINNGIFVNLTTNANVNAASNFIIKVAYRA